MQLHTVIFTAVFLTKLYGQVYNFPVIHGLVAQLGAHHIRIVGVGSSNLLTSTNQNGTFGYQKFRFGLSEPQALHGCFSKCQFYCSESKLPPYEGMPFFSSIILLNFEFNTGIFSKDVVY